MKSIFTILSLLMILSLSAQEQTNVSSLDLTAIQQSIMSPKANKSMTGERIRIGGERYNNGISMHAPAHGYLYLGGEATRLEGFVGVDDYANRRIGDSRVKSLVHTGGLKVFYYETEPGQPRRIVGVGDTKESIEKGSVEFLIKGDGKTLWKSGVVREGDAPKKISIKLKGIKMLKLEVTDGGDGISGDIANWADLKVIHSGSKPIIVTKDYLDRLAATNEIFANKLAPKLNELPKSQNEKVEKDWLIVTPELKSEVYRKGERELVLSNGLVSRTFRIAPNAATVGIKNLVSGEEYLRSIQPEALLMIDSIEYAIGGLSGQVEKGYLLPEWLDDMYSPSDAFSLVDFQINDLKPHIAWKQKRWIPSTQWEQTGKELTFIYQHSSEKLKGITVEVHYALYDNIPLIGKWMSVKNDGNKDIRINHFTSEIIAHHETENYVDAPKTWKKPNLFLQNDFAFGGFTYEESNQSLTWETDPEYTSQGNYAMVMPCILKSRPPVGPNKLLGSNDSFTSYRTYVLALDGSNRERNSLAQRKMYRTLSPWATENPIFMHLTSTNPKVVKQAIDQSAETGYEMVILSFGSGLNMEKNTSSNHAKFKELADYAHSKGIELGGYSLFSSRKISPETDVVDINTGKPGGAKFGNAPCAGSEWGIEYYSNLKAFFENTGFDFLEHDGPYPGDFCASTDHPGHDGYHDSQYTQWQSTVDFYQYLRANGVYMNIPDFYFLNGSNKCSIGYREVNWSLPRARQIILGRQNIYDGTWSRTPSMGWTFVPLTQYHGGGKAATLEPLSEHLNDYQAHMIQNYGAGVQACYRGPRLYDTEETKQVVIDQISHYKQFRDILNADMIHLRRPDGRDWDGFMHVDPKLGIKGFAMLFNPTNQPIERRISLPLYYTGLETQTLVSLNGQTWRRYELGRDYSIEVDVVIPANSYQQILIQ